MAGELVTGYLRLVPTVQGIQGATAKALMPATREADAAGLSSGKAFGESLSRNMKRVVKGGLAGGALFAGIVAKKGIDRLLGIEDARASLAGLGNDAKKVDKIMNNALDSVRGTAFGMADAGKVAASAVAAGIKPGRALVKDLKLVADAATIAKVPLGEMGAVFNKVAASNKIQGDVIAQLGDMGIPIVQLLAKELGKTASETLTLASQGKINFATFSKAMQAGLGGAALKSGNTTRGAWANMQASLGRIGANLLTGLFPRLKGGFQSITTFLTPLEAKASDFGQSLNTAFSGIDDTVEDVRRTLGKLDFNKIDGQKLGASLATGLGVALNSFDSLAGKLFDKIGDVLGKVDWIGLGIVVGTQALPFVLGLATGLINGISDPHLWAGIWQHLPQILLAVLAVAFAPSKLAGPLERILTRIPIAGKLLAAIVRGLQGIGGRITGAAGRALGYFWRGLTDGGIPGGRVVAELLDRIFSPLFSLFPRMVSWGLRLQKQLLDQGAFAMQGLGLGVRQGIGGTLRFLVGLPGRLLRAVGSLARLLFPQGMKVVDGLVDGARGRVGAALSYMRSLPGKLKSSIKGEGTLLKSVGASIVQGLKDGIAGAWHKVTDYLSAKISGLSSVAKKLLHINSPSKVFADIGHSVGEGMHLGITKSMPMVERASADLVGSTIPGGRAAYTPAAYRAPVYAPAAPAAAGGPMVAKLVDPTVRVHKDGLVELMDSRVEVYQELAKTTGGQTW